MHLRTIGIGNGQGHLSTPGQPVDPRLWLQFTTHRASHPITCNIPAKNDPITAVIGIHRIIHLSVEVFDVLGSNSAKLGKVELGIATHQRIEGPLDPVQIILQRPGPLMDLHRCTHPTVGKPGKYGSHM